MSVSAGPAPCLGVYAEMAVWVPSLEGAVHPKLWR